MATCSLIKETMGLFPRANEDEVRKAANILLSQLSSGKPERELSLEGLSESLDNPNFYLFMAIQNKTDPHYVGKERVYLGMATIFFQKNLSGWIGEIHDVVVDRSHRRRGVGELLTKKLLQTAEEFAREKKEDIKLYLTSRPRRVSANRLYRKLGFRLVARAYGKSGTNLYKMTVLAEPELQVCFPLAIHGRIR